MSTATRMLARSAVPGHLLRSACRHRQPRSRDGGAAATSPPTRMLARSAVPGHLLRSAAVTANPAVTTAALLQRRWYRWGSGPYAVLLRPAADPGEPGPEHRPGEEGVRAGALRQVPSPLQLEDGHLLLRRLRLRVVRPSPRPSFAHAGPSLRRGASVVSGHNLCYCRTTRLQRVERTLEN
ncbi:hypothetical protein D1007_60123 [Hordeum vulgare]|nr:hypothetical protein D1007_60123 [Hordeum vulgare]